MSTKTEQERNRELDKVRAAIFVGSNAAFMGPLMASLGFQWTRDIQTAATDYVNIYWNPDDFDALDHDKRISSMLHELGHVWRLHGIRRGDREGEPWNWACDVRINRDLRISKYDCDGPCFVQDHPEIKSTTEEDIYDEIRKNPPPPQPQAGQGDPQAGTCSCSELGPPTKAQAQSAINKVIQAAQQADMAGKPGDVPGDVETLLNTYLSPQIPWKQIVQQWFIDKLGSFRTYRRPNRRYLARGMLLKGKMRERNRLAHLVYAIDASCSVTDEQLNVFNSEVKYLKDTYKPKKMTIIIFDTRIQRVIEVMDDDAFDSLKIVGRGGTSLTCVKHFIEDSDATAAIIFSDLECAPMGAVDIPVIWICVDNTDATVPYGKLLHVKSKDFV
jgi:predicted metal-dependent peptidase